MSSEDGGEATKKRKEHGSTATDTDGRKTKHHRMQLYRSVWELEPIFKGWLKPVAGNETKAFSRCCNVQMVSEITVLKNHAKGTKHMEKGVCHFGGFAERLYTEMIKSFTDANVPLKNIVGFASDGCNTMMGKNNSVSSRLKNDLPGITVQRCICHSLHLCASAACKQLPRMCEDLARDVYGYFKNSAKRVAQLKEFQEFCHVEPHKLLKPSQTHWLSLHQVVKRMCTQWDALRLFFTDQWLEARLNAAENIFNALNNESLRLYFYFLDWVLPKFTGLNKHFQSEKVVITTLRNKMCETYKDLLLSFMDRDYVLHNNIARIDPTDTARTLPLNAMYLGVSVMQRLNTTQQLPPAAVTDFRMRCQMFVKVACQEIQKRFNFDDPILTQIECLSPAIAIDAHSRALYPSLFPLMQTVPRILDMNDTDRVQAIDDEWRKMPLMNLPASSKEMDVDAFWYNALQMKDLGGEQVFKHLASFVLDVLVFPHSNASCERVFSKVNLLKTKPRNRLITDTLNGLMHTSECVKIAGGCSKFTPTETMLRSMTASNLYEKKGPSTSAAPDASVTDSDSEPEVEFNY
ncbi:hypothetical protein SKAU_G00021200 [Synaphobranchus kaupii]|uniref:HAT C-terminal dimerisation domain-containing protein n=1 Tax=Synaphobranchus kaupii TaxID=118154 RepID=A0A9Q1JEE1_SYNKA|nr:hypothetical protein SKAU_G00021200 [Synaphobranchus kaupii]